MPDHFKPSLLPYLTFPMFYASLGSPTGQGAEGAEQGPDHADAPAWVQLILPGRRIRLHLNPTVWTQLEWIFSLYTILKKTICIMHILRTSKSWRIKRSWLIKFIKFRLTEFKIFIIKRGLVMLLVIICKIWEFHTIECSPSCLWEIFALLMLCLPAAHIA